MKMVIEIDLDNAMDLSSNLQYLLTTTTASLFNKMGPDTLLSDSFKPNVAKRPNVMVISEARAALSSGPRSTPTPIMLRIGLINEAFDSDTWIADDVRDTGSEESHDAVVRIRKK